MTICLSRRANNDEVALGRVRLFLFDAISRLSNYAMYIDVEVFSFRFLLASARAPARCWRDSAGRSRRRLESDAHEFDGFTGHIAHNDIAATIGLRD